MEATRIGPYRLERLLGFGGMGEVHLAYDTRRDRLVALKLLPEGLSRDTEYQQRFRRESHVAARLRDPHVIPIHDYGEIDGHLYIDMRLVDGQNVREILEEQGPMAPARAVHLVEQVAEALEAAHADDLVHRDIKPSNVLVTATDFVYVVDFGIARSVGTARTSLTLTGVTVGTLDYMAPERFAGRAVDGRADVYSLACLLHECLTDSPPFAGDDLPALMCAHLFSEPPKPSAAAPGVPEAMDAVIATGMAKDVADRYATPTALADAARAALTGTPAAVPSPRRRPASRPAGEPRGVVAAEAAGPTGRPADVADAATREADPTSGPRAVPERPTSRPPAAAGSGPRPAAVPADRASAAPGPDTVGAWGDDRTVADPSGPRTLGGTQPAAAADLLADTDHSAATVVDRPAQRRATGPRTGTGHPVADDAGPTQHIVTRSPRPDAPSDPHHDPGSAPSSSNAGPMRLVGIAAAAVVVLLVGAVVLLGMFGLGAEDTSPPPAAGAGHDHGGGPVAASIAVPTVRERVPVGPTPGYLEIAPNGRFAYIASRDAGVVTVLDTTINQVTATIPIPAGPPQFVAFSPDGSRAYISIYNTERTVNLIGVLDTTTNSLLTTIPVGRRPFASATTPDGSRLYVPSHDDGRLDVIDTATNTVIREIPVAPNPHWVAFSADGSRLYTANHESNLVSVIDTATDAVVSTVAVGTSPHSTTVSPDGSRVAVVNFDSSELSIIDTATNAVVATVPVGTRPQDVAFAADGRFVYTANVEANTVSVIDAATNRVSATIPAGDGPTSVAVTPDGTRAYVTDLGGGEVLVLDLTAA